MGSEKLTETFLLPIDHNPHAHKLTRISRYMLIFKTLKNLAGGALISYLGKDSDEGA